MIKIVDRNRIPEIRNQIQALSSKKIKVGILSKSGESMAVIAGANEFGVPGRIPERAFLRITMDRPKTIDDAVKFAERIFDHGQDASKMLDAMGASLVSSIQDTIESNLAPANAQITIERKGSAKTLQDTGRMKQAISWEVV